MQFETCAAINGWRDPEIGQHLQYRSKLQGRKRNPGEAATSYASEIGCLVARAFPGYPEDILRELTLKALLDGLPEGELKHEVQMHNPQTVEVAVRLIERFENSSKKVRSQVRMVGEESVATIGELKVLLVQILEMLKKMETGKKSKKPPVCYKCGKEVHYRSQCPDLQKQGN